MRALLLTIVTLLAASAVLPAQATASWLLTSGREVRGQLLGVDSGRVLLRVAQPDGQTKDEVIPLADFADHSAFRIKRATVPPDDVKARIELARFAADRGLLSAARQELRKARDLAKNQEIGEDVLQDLRARAVAVLERALQQLMAEKRPSEAKSVLAQLMANFGDKMTEEQKQRLVSAVHGAQRTFAPGETAAEDARAVAARQGKLKPIQDQIGRADQLQRQGLMDSKSYSRAYDNFQQAIRLYEGALVATSRLAAKEKDDAALTRTLGDMDVHAKENLATTHLNAASLKLANGQFRDAMAHTNKVLADDPRNAQAAALRARIEVAANDDGWGTGSYWRK